MKYSGCIDGIAAALKQKIAIPSGGM